jgi:hypothetical protein
MIRRFQYAAVYLPCLITLAVHLTPRVAADETTRDKVEDVGKDTKKNFKKGYRKAQDKSCEWVNGKLECALKKAGNKVKNAGEEVKNKAEDADK